MSGQTLSRAGAEGGARTPVGTVGVVDPHPLNWLYVTWNTMEEPVRTDERGRMVGAVMEESRWVDEKTLEIGVRRGIRFQDGEVCDAHSVKRAFEEMQRWKAPHPPGSNLNIDQETVAEVVDDYRLQLRFPAPDGLVLGKMRGMHIPSTRFWDEIGFGYRKIGTGEGHW